MKSTSTEPPERGDGVWGLLDDRLGHARQVQGVVAALGGGRLIDLAYARPLRRPDLLAPATTAHLTAAVRADLVAPWPRVAIACGRRPAAVLRWLKARAGERLLAVQVMRPGSLRGFDLVAVPSHDRPAADPRVVATLAAPHPFGGAVLEAARRELPPAAAALPTPRLALLVGGPTRGVPFTLGDVDRLAAAVDALARRLGASVLATTSPRSPAGTAARLRAALEVPHLVHDLRAGEPNPLRAFLAAAARVIVTADSASMLSEAAAAGVPVHVFALPRNKAKFARLEAALAEAGVVQPWTIEATPPSSPVDEAARLARLIRARVAV